MIIFEIRYMAPDGTRDPSAAKIALSGCENRFCQSADSEIVRRSKLFCMPSCCGETACASCVATRCPFCARVPDSKAPNQVLFACRPQLSRISGSSAQRSQCSTIVVTGI